MSVLQFRSRMLCLLDEIYVAQHARPPDDIIIRLSARLQDELWLVVCLSPLAVTDLRAQTQDILFLSDASEAMKASVSSDIPLVFARELHRHVAAGLGSSLLGRPGSSSTSSLTKRMPLVSHPLWLVLARGLQFSVFHRKEVRSHKHINICWRWRACWSWKQSWHREDKM